MAEPTIQDNTKNWLNVEKYSFFKLLFTPFLIYVKQFIQFFFISLIPEFLIFGIFWVIEFDFTYDLISRIFILDLDFRDDLAKPFLIPLIIIAVLLLILRSGIITSISWKTIAQGKANPFWAIIYIFKLIKQVFLATVIMIIFLFVPGAILLLAMLFGLRMPGVMWIMITFSVGMPIIIGSRICLFNVGITKDKLPVGTAFQKSWDLTSSLNWMKTVLVLIIFASLAFIIPWILTNYLNNTVGQWTGLVMIAVRAALYPLFDIAMSVTYIHSEYDTINRAVFRDDILRQKELSEMLYRE